MSAFNDIEHHLRSALGAAQYVEFAEMVRDFGKTNNLTRRQIDTLFAFRSLRNAICHSHYYHGQPIAEPVMEVVRQIERLRDQIKRPPKAIDVLGKQDIGSVDLDEPIGTALEYIRDFNYSQLPVYRQHTYVGLLTTNAVARWLASQLTSNDGLAESESVSVVLEFAEPHECALLVPSEITVTQAVHQLQHGGNAGAPVAALVITENGEASEPPLGLVVADDLPMLLEAVTI
jgi:predicted transcriptional regulator